MRTLNIALEVDYDKDRVSPSEVIFNVKRALDEYFNRYEGEYGEDAILVSSVRVIREEASNLSE